MNHQGWIGNGVDHPAKILAVGIDTLWETFNVLVPTLVTEKLEAEKARAVEREFDGAETFRLGDESCFMDRSGKGVRFYVRFEGFDLVIRHTPDWGVTVRYSSSGLWQSGVQLLRARAYEFVRAVFHVPRGKDDDGRIAELDPAQWQRVTQVHVSVDLLSEALRDIMVPSLQNGVVMHSGVKQFTVGADGRLQTLTLGGHGSAQVQVYDKGREVREASGKTWFKEVWERNGGVVIKSFENIWRVEMRLAADWLKDRGCYTFEQFEEKAVLLLQDCLFHRRLTEPNGDTNRARWPMHWLWAMTMLAVTGEVIAKPLGLRLVRDTQALPEKMKRSAAGTLRAIAVAHKALYPFDRRNVDELIRDIARDCIAMAIQDGAHHEKSAQLFERYKRIALPA